MHRHEPLHHPSEVLLMDYAGGATQEGEAVLIATHLAHCPLCRREARLYEAVGGALLEMIEPAPIRADLMGEMLSSTAVSDPDSLPVGPSEASRPLAAYEGENLDQVSWRRLPGGITTYTLACSQDRCRVRLLQVPANHKLAWHAHVGDEWMQVLRGSFVADGEFYRAGDFVQSDGGSSHSPVTNEGCVCLVLARAPSRFTNPLIRLLAPILGI